MSPAMLTQPLATQLYTAMVNGDVNLVQMFARAAVQSAAELQTDMWNDAIDGGESNRSFPDANDIALSAISYTEDMLDEFMDNVKKAIQREGALRMRTTFSVELT